MAYLSQLTRANEIVSDDFGSQIKNKAVALAELLGRLLQALSRKMVSGKALAAGVALKPAASALKLTFSFQ